MLECTGKGKEDLAQGAKGGKTMRIKRWIGFAAAAAGAACCAARHRMSTSAARLARFGLMACMCVMYVSVCFAAPTNK